MSGTAKARENKDSAPRQVLYMAFELGEKSWKLGFTIGFGQKPREKTIVSRDRDTVLQEIRRAKARFGLEKDCEVQSLYEAGRDGFWLHRFLLANGIRNTVVDSTAIEQSRRKKTVKTDRVDLGKLLHLLMRRDAGEKKALCEVNVPSVFEEDRRHLHREATKTRHDLTRVTNRIRGLLSGQGLKVELSSDFGAQLETLKTWDGSDLPPMVKARLKREWEKVEFLRKQVNELERQRLEYVREGEGEALDQVRQLLQLRGIGPKSAWLYVMEFFSWRKFKNGKQVGSLAGLAPTPYQSGETAKEHGICKAGNKHIRTIAIEIAWCWLRYQPESELTKWYERRYDDSGPVAHKIGIVAVARKLLIALWRYLEQGLVPEGAQFKPARQF